VRIAMRTDGKPQEIVRSFKRRRDPLAYRAPVPRDRGTGSVVVLATMTLKAFLDWWLKAVGQRVRPRTVASCQDVLARYVRTDFGACRLDLLSTLLIQRHIEVLTRRTSSDRVVNHEAGKSHTNQRYLSARTIQYAMSILGTALRRRPSGVSCLNNPSVDVELPRQQRQEMWRWGKEREELPEITLTGISTNGDAREPSAYSRTYGAPCFSTTVERGFRMVGSHPRPSNEHFGGRQGSARASRSTR
jgi:hypothetical protein